MNNLTDSELLEIIHEHYYSIGATGSEAVSSLVNDIADKVWEETHGVPTSRMKQLVVEFTLSLIESESWNVMAGVSNKPFNRKAQVGRMTRIIRKVVR